MRDKPPFGEPYAGLLRLPVPEMDLSLRPLDAFLTAGGAVDDGVVIDLSARAPRPHRGPAGS